jgi:hypothetical protein
MHDSLYILSLPACEAKVWITGSRKMAMYRAVVSDGRLIKMKYFVMCGVRHRRSPRFHVLFRRQLSHASIDPALNNVEFATLYLRCRFQSPPINLLLLVADPHNVDF